jgi:hypothetical protein
MMVNWHEFRESTGKDEKRHDGISMLQMTLPDREFKEVALTCAHCHSLKWMRDWFLPSRCASVPRVLAPRPSASVA